MVFWTHLTGLLGHHVFSADLRTYESGHSFHNVLSGFIRIVLQAYSLLALSFKMSTLLLQDQANPACSQGIANNEQPQQEETWSSSRPPTTLNTIT